MGQSVRPRIREVIGPLQLEGVTKLDYCLLFFEQCITGVMWSLFERVTRIVKGPKGIGL